MRFFIFFAVFAAVLTLNAKTVPFRSGEIYAAAVNRTRPAISNWNKNLFGTDSASSFAAIAVKLHAKRKISIFDYALAVNGRNYPCVAIRTGNGAFVYTTAPLEAKNNEFFTLLFMLNDVTPSGGKISAALVSQLPPGSHEPVIFELSNSYGNAILPVNSIKKEGNF